MTGEGPARLQPDMRHRGIIALNFANLCAIAFIGLATASRSRPQGKVNVAFENYRFRVGPAMRTPGLLSGDDDAFTKPGRTNPA
ncbi:hypothetical protein THS27_07885 [Thalassospira sp. MCCC 1A01428]|nr:hypothetical protein THS27_07885 [Thalassospira sp. MCCC 1A01428]